MEARGRILLESAPDRQIEIHRSAWPRAENNYSSIVGRVLTRILAGEPVIRDGETIDCGLPSIGIHGLSASEKAVLDAKLPPPPPKRNRPSGGDISRWAIELPWMVRTDPRSTHRSDTRFPSYVALVDGPTMMITTVIRPIMNDLAASLRIRTGHGPQTLNGRVKAIEQSVEAHRILGLDWRPMKRIVDPALAAESVIEARRMLVTGWMDHPQDLGERAMVLLCTRLAKRYYSKALRDGTAKRAKVITVTTQPRLSATLGTWESLVEYLGEKASNVDVNPYRMKKAKVPSSPPEEVVRRIDVAREWFYEVFDPAHACQEPGSPSLWGLVPAAHEADSVPLRERLKTHPTGERPSDLPSDASDMDAMSLQSVPEVPSHDLTPVPELTEMDEQAVSHGAHDPGLWLTSLPWQTVDLIFELWGTTVLQRFPDVLVENLHPETSFAQLVRPAALVWESLALTCWYLCFGPYSRTTLDGLEDYVEPFLEELSELGSPVDRTVFRQLIEAGKGNDWLFDSGSLMTVAITVGVDGPEPALNRQDNKQMAREQLFRTLRDIVTHHRRTWLKQGLDTYLDARWKRDLNEASIAYQELEVGRGKPPTVRQAYPKLSKAAKAWFGGSVSRTAAVLQISGPVAQVEVQESDRDLPGDMRLIRARVNEILGGRLDGQGRCYWPMRRRYELSRQVNVVLSHWQASGELPSRPAFGKNWLLKEIFHDDFEAGYLEYIEAIRQALEQIGHAAADAPLGS